MRDGIGSMAGDPARTVIVAGATGRLGAIAELLLDRGHRVKALTRSPDSPRAMALRRAGAEVVFGDLDDPASITAAAGGADALFATGTAHRVGPDGELVHGLNVANASAAAGVGQLVYVSGDGAAPDSPLPLFRSKFRIEEHIRSLHIPHTILAPVYFMENLFNPWNLPFLRSGWLPTPIPTQARLQQTAIADLLALAAEAIERPSEFAGQRLQVASDEVTGEEAAVAASRVLDRSFQAERIQVEQLSPGLVALFAWLERPGHAVDIEGLHRHHPEIRWHSYPAWLRSVRPRFREFCTHPALAGR